MNKPCIRCGGSADIAVRGNATCYRCAPAVELYHPYEYHVQPVVAPVYAVPIY